MTTSEQPHNIENQSFTQTVRVKGGTLPPSFDLVQPAFNLTQVDFLKLKSTSPTWTAAGSAVFSFGLAYILPLLVRSIRSDNGVRDVWAEDWWISGALCLMGAILLLVGTLYSRERRAVFKRIEAHFAANPGEFEYRIND